jgi:hypothetical protein
VDVWGPRYGFQDTKVRPTDQKLSKGEVRRAVIKQLKEWCKQRCLPHK